MYSDAIAFFSVLNYRMIIHAVVSDWHAFPSHKTLNSITFWWQWWVLEVSLQVWVLYNKLTRIHICFYICYFGRCLYVKPSTTESFTDPRMQLIGWGLWVLANVISSGFLAIQGFLVFRFLILGSLRTVQWALKVHINFGQNEENKKNVICIDKTFSVSGFLLYQITKMVNSVF